MAQSNDLQGFLHSSSRNSNQRIFYRYFEIVVLMTEKLAYSRATSAIKNHTCFERNL